MAASKTIRVLIVDDSYFFRVALRKALSSDMGIEVVGSASNALEAEKRILELSPDVVTMDVEMPGMTGTDFLKKLLPVHPVPVVLVSAMNINAFDALDAGAVDFVRKPDNMNGSDFTWFCSELVTKIKVASIAKIKMHSAIVREKIPLHELKSDRNAPRLIAIGASTGGTEATAEILQQLPESMPGIVITQHMPPGFTKMYADRLNRICSISVAEAKNGDRVRQGLAYIAPGDKHMTVHKDANGYYVKCKDGEKVNGHCPSVDVLFQSAAKAAGSNAIGIILTGMGRDGAEGLLKMKQSGAFTIGQDQQSCVVYGMPKEAYKLGAVDQQAACQDIAGMVIQRLNKDNR